MAARDPEKVLVVITIDTECDHDPQWVRSRPLAFRSVIEGLPYRLQPAFEAVGARPTYLLTVEVMENREAVEALRGLGGSYELGTHLHSAFIEPAKKFQQYAGVDSPDFQCHCPPDVEYRKLDNLSGLFEQSFGYRPLTFRAGRFGAGPATLPTLERLGYLVDTSVTPYIRWKHPDGDVDYRRAPEQPYFPVSGSLTVADWSRQTGLLEIPVTMQPRWLRGPRWLRPWFSSASAMKDVVEYQLARHVARPVVVLNMMFHSMEVIPKASPYPQSEAEVDRFLDDMSDVLFWCRRQGMTFASAADVHAELTGRGVQASPR